MVGHRDVPGRPAIYATTRTFLDYFDLKTLNELPTLSQIKDLDKINEELDLEDEIVEARSIELTPEQDAAEADAEDASLDEVTDRVNEIQENIKNMFRQETPDTGEIDELEELDKPEVSRSQGNPDGRPQ